MSYRYVIVKTDGSNKVIGFSNSDSASTDSSAVIEIEPIDIPMYQHTAIYVNGKVEFIEAVVSKTREQRVAELDVTISTGKVFDGDEKSQDRMLRAIAIANISGQTTTEWKMADNSVQTVTLEELQEALTLAGQEMSRIWMGS